MDAAASALGVALPPQEQPVLELFPESTRALRVYAAMQGQWHLGPDGLPDRMDYLALPKVQRGLGLGGLPPRAASALFEQLQVMERAAVEWYSERRLQARNGSTR